MIILGDKVQDKVSGLVGITVSRIEYLNGCVQYGVQPKIKKVTDEIQTWNIDEEQLIVVPSKKIKIKKKPTGGATKLAQKRY